MWVCPTERHHSTGTPTLPGVQLRCVFSRSYCSGALPSTALGSTPFFIMAASAVPAMIDCPTTRWR